MCVVCFFSRFSSCIGVIMTPELTATAKWCGEILLRNNLDKLAQFLSRQNWTTEYLAVAVSSVVVMTPMHGENLLKKQTTHKNLYCNLECKNLSMHWRHHGMNSCQSSSEMLNNLCFIKQDKTKTIIYSKIIRGNWYTDTWKGHKVRMVSLKQVFLIYEGTKSYLSRKLSKFSSWLMSLHLILTCCIAIYQVSRGFLVV